MIAEHVVGDAFEDLGEDFGDFGEVEEFSIIDNNSEDIDEFLQDDAAKYAASVVIQDTEEALNYLGLDVDFDWMHHALTAEDHEELKDMAEAFFGLDDDYEGDCDLVEEEDSCMDLLAELIPNMTECNYVAKLDSCSFELEECYTRVVVNNETLEGDCWELAESFGVDLDALMPEEEDDDDDDYEDYDEESGDCLDVLANYIENITFCEYAMVEEFGEITECNVTVVVNDEEMSGDCEEVSAAFGVDLDDVMQDMNDSDDECEVEEEEGDCYDVLSQFLNVTSCSYYTVEDCGEITEC
jgi:hypothetical protein